MRASWSLLALLAVVAGALILVQRPILGLLVLILTALLVNLPIPTGSAVDLNPTALLIPALFVFWLLSMMLKGKLTFVRSRTITPLLLFLLMGIASLLIGNVTWDPFVPRPSNFLLVQLAQLAIFFFSVAAYVLVANFVHDEKWLIFFTATFLVIGGFMATIQFFPVARAAGIRISTAALTRAPFWSLLLAIAGGQLVFNRKLARWKQLLLIPVIAGILYYSFFLNREVISFWVGIVAVIGTLGWLRFPRLRWIVFLVFLALLLAGVLFPAVYQFAGGDAEWQLSGVSRIDLNRRVLEVSMRNPITGLGPAAYRLYASVQPLVWRGGAGIWIGAVVSSHNNYMDIFSFFGIVGLLLFVWFIVELALLGLRLRRSFSGGFGSGYINGMLAALASMIVIMFLADWFLPFVYNVGYAGFQASILVWMFLGGLVALEQIDINGLEHSTQITDG